MGSKTIDPQAEQEYPVDRSPIPPQDYLIEELNARKWSEERFRKESGLLPFELTEILNCSRPICANEAVKIAKAFGTSAELWLGLQVEFYWEMLCKQCGELAEARAVQALAEEFREALRGVKVETPNEQGGTLASIERAAIEARLEANDQNRSATAKSLGIGERTLYRKLELYGVPNKKLESADAE